jgi:hypothetical protein
MEIFKIHNTLFSKMMFNKDTNKLSLYRTTDGIKRSSVSYILDKKKNKNHKYKLNFQKIFDACQF